MPDQNITRRLPAEWEPQDAVQLTFPHADSDWADMLDAVLPVFVQLAETISRFETVLIVCQDATATRNLLAGANTANLRFAEISSNDTWARDHGGIVIEENGRPVVLDFMFNGWGLKFPADKDNRITRALWERGFFVPNTGTPAWRWRAEALRAMDGVPCLPLPNACSRPTGIHTCLKWKQKKN